MSTLSQYNSYTINCRFYERTSEEKELIIKVHGKEIKTTMSIARKNILVKFGDNIKLTICIERVGKQNG